MLLGYSVPDGRRFDDKYQHAKCSCRKEYTSSLRHGGALVLAADSPLAKKTVGTITLHRDLDLLNEIEEAMRLMDTQRVLSFAHIPCAKATSFGLSAADVLRLHVGGKDRVREHNPGCIISCHVHVDYFGWQRRSRFARYFLNRNNLRAWSQTKEGGGYPELREALAA